MHTLTSAIEAYQFGNGYHKCLHRDDRWLYWKATTMTSQLKHGYMYVLMPVNKISESDDLKLFSNEAIS